MEEEMMLFTAQCLVEHAKSIKEMNARFDRIEERLLDVKESMDRHYYAIIDYANKMGIRGVNRAAVGKLERKASVMSKKQGYCIGRKDTVNTYHVDVLQEVFRARF